MKIGFDFDKVFVDYPPFVPDFLIDYLYKNHKNSKEIYRFPNALEQKIRIFSHFPVFRHPIKKNVDVLKILSNKKGNEIFLISSRYSFLKKRTEKWLELFGLKRYFKGIYFNYNDEQPHIFKHKKIDDLKLDYYIDDDIDLLSYLENKGIKTKLFWLDGKLFINKENISPKITIVNNLSEILAHI